MTQRPRTVSLHQVLSNESLPAGQGDVPDVPPIGEMRMLEHRSRAVSRESVVYDFNVGDERADHRKLGGAF